MLPVQVLEQNIKWKAAVMQTTLHSAGTAVLPHKKPLMKVITALFDAPSKVGADQSIWSHCASSTLTCCLAGLAMFTVRPIEWCGPCVCH